MKKIATIAAVLLPAGCLVQILIPIIVVILVIIKPIALVADFFGSIFSNRSYTLNMYCETVESPGLPNSYHLYDDNLPKIAAATHDINPHSRKVKKRDTPLSFKVFDHIPKPVELEKYSDIVVVAPYRYATLKEKKPLDIMPPAVSSTKWKNMVGIYNKDRPQVDNYQHVYEVVISQRQLESVQKIQISIMRFVQSRLGQANFNDFYVSSFSAYMNAYLNMALDRSGLIENSEGGLFNLYVTNGQHRQAATIDKAVEILFPYVTQWVVNQTNPNDKKVRKLYNLLTAKELAIINNLKNESENKKNADDETLQKIYRPNKNDGDKKGIYYYDKIDHLKKAERRLDDVARWFEPYEAWVENSLFISMARYDPRSRQFVLIKSDFAPQPWLVALRNSVGSKAKAPEKPVTMDSTGKASGGVPELVNLRLVRMSQIVNMVAAHGCHKIKKGRKVEPEKDPTYLQSFLTGNGDVLAGRALTTLEQSWVTLATKEYKKIRPKGKLGYAFFAGIMTIESGFDPKAIALSSGDKKYGLCQILSKTWNEITKGTPDKPDILEPNNNAKYCGMLIGDIEKKIEAKTKKAPTWEQVLASKSQNEILPPVVSEITKEHISKMKEFISNKDIYDPSRARSSGVNLLDLTGKRRIIVESARQMVGGSYLLGAYSPETRTFDCSRLTIYAYRKAGIELKSGSDAQCQMGSAISAKEVQPGDLVCWTYPDGSGSDHVTIYSGNGYMIGAENPNDGIRERPVYTTLRGNVVQYRRILGGGE